MLASSVYPFVWIWFRLKEPLGCCLYASWIFLPNINFVGFSFLGDLRSPSFVVQAAYFWEEICGIQSCFAGSDLDASPGLDSKNFTLCWCCLSLASSGVLFCCSLFRFSV